MAARPRETRSGEDPAHGLFNAKESVRNTDTRFATPGAPKVTIDTVLHVPDCSYGLDEIHFVVWYRLTTTLSLNKIAELFNYLFKLAELLDRWTITDIVYAITSASAGPLRMASDFNIDCVDVKRTTKTRQNHKYLSIAASLWDQPATELVLCPRGKRRDDRHTIVAIKHTQPRLLSNLDKILPLANKAYLHTIPLARASLTFAFWLAILQLWFVPPEDLASPLQRTLSSYIHYDLTSTAAALHLLFERTLDDLPAFAMLRTTPFGLLVRQTFVDFWRMKIVIGLALELCSVLGLLPNSFRDYMR